MAAKVIVKETVVVTPAEPTPTRLLTLSALDSQLFTRFNAECLFLYRPAGPTDRAETVSRVKSALSRALVPYYPLAGRVVASKTGGSSLHVVCHAQGAVFIEAVADHALEELEAAQRHVDQWRSFLSVHVEDVLKGGPLTVMQLTWLNDGAVVLCVGTAHCVTDGPGGAGFIKYFADLAAGRAGLGKQEPRLVWERHLLDLKDPGPGRAGSSSHLELLFDPILDVSGSELRYTNEMLVPTSIKFDKTSIEELKCTAIQTSPSELAYTSFEVLTAHLWRSWARALNLAANQTVRVMFSVNFRDRVKPSLPAGYYGNSFVFGCAQAHAKEVTEETLGHVAGLVRSAKERVDDEYVRAVVEQVSRTRAYANTVGTLVVSPWNRLGLENVDFGMGKPVCFGPVICKRICLMGGDRAGNIKAIMAVPASAVDEYEYLVRYPYTRATPIL